MKLAYAFKRLTAAAVLATSISTAALSQEIEQNHTAQCAEGGWQSLTLDPKAGVIFARACRAFKPETIAIQCPTLLEYRSRWAQIQRDIEIILSGDEDHMPSESWIDFLTKAEVPKTQKDMRVDIQRIEDAIKSAERAEGNPYRCPGMS